ncbi:MAG: NUDIX hydrolase [Candidatus Aenigmarchaeota archaeon]|nr:NUDIX hydrolase [Candidatus Aenigmarchaeota archaeon]
MNEQKFHVGIKALILNEKKQILIFKANPAELKGDKIAHWDLAGGRIKEGDSVEETLRKEVEEETGVDGKNLEVLDPFHGSISNIKIPIGDEKFGLVLFVYLCKLHTNQEFKLSFEHTEYKWASIDEAKKLLSYKYAKSFTEKLDELKS